MLTFSERYLRPQVVQEDSPRMRVQLLALFDHYVPVKDHREIRNLLRLRSGFEVEEFGDAFHWRKFFKTGNLRDILDAITVVQAVLGRYENGRLEHGRKGV